MKTPRNVNTQRRMLRRRRQENLPHSSLDFDGDGTVSQRDYFLSKVFDRDQDNRLNELEALNARQSREQGLGVDDYRDYMTFRRQEGELQTFIERVLHRTCPIGKPNYVV